MSVDALAMTVLDRHASALGLEGVRAGRGRITSTGIGVVEMGPGIAVLKVALSAPADAALARESAVLEELGCDARLAGWRELLPRPLAHGVVEGHTYRLDAALAGSVLARRVRRFRSAATLVEAAAAAIAPMHAATGAIVCVDEAIAARWIDEHVATLARAGMRDGVHGGLGRVAGRLRSRLIGTSVPAAWIHGDLWLGNILGDGRVSGIVDWEAARGEEHPLHDLIHLLLYTRRLVTGRQLGAIVRRQMERPVWSAAERSVLERYAPWWDRSELGEREALLLYWLRHAATHARQQPARDALRYRVWERRNVATVVARA